MKTTPKKTAKTAAKTSVRLYLSASDKLKQVTYKMLDRLEEALEQDIPDSDDGDMRLQRHHERLFGNKTSLAATLPILAELLMKLEIQNTSPTAVEDDQKDKLLLDAFVHRIRGYDVHE